MPGGINTFIEKLRDAGELYEVHTPVDPCLEITEITDRISKLPGGGKAILFHQTGTSFPVLMNAYGSEKRMCIVLGVQSFQEAEDRIESLMSVFSRTSGSFFIKLYALPELLRLSSWFPRRVRRRGVCQEVIWNDPDLSRLPVLKCWPADGGRFITLPVVHTYHPDTRQRNVGMYRMQVFSANTAGMHWHRHKTGAKHFMAWKEKKQKMPVAVILGGDPVYAYAATAPLPEGIDEYILAGFLRKRRVNLVPCLTQDIEVPEDADIVIEGYVDPEEPLVKEGPFGDHTGFYSLCDAYPKFHVTCITHRKDAVYPATIVGIPPQEDTWIAKVTERIFLPPLKMALAPEIHDIDLPWFGVAHNLAIVSIRKSYPGQAAKIAGSLWGAGQMMFNKVLVVVDHTVNVHNYHEVFEAIQVNVSIPRDLYRQTGPLDVLDHAAVHPSFGGKLCIDATRKDPGEMYSGNTLAWNILPFPELTGQDDVTIHPAKIWDEGHNLLVMGILDKTVYSLAKAMVLVYNTIRKEKRRCIAMVFTDPGVEKLSTESMLWYVLNQVDPLRDLYFYANDEGIVVLAIDAARKSKKSDNFERNWPNLITMDDEIIHRVDAKWESYGLGLPLDSPSLHYTLLKKGSGAEVREED